MNDGDKTMVLEKVWRTHVIWVNTKLFKKRNLRWFNIKLYVIYMVFFSDGS